MHYRVCQGTKAYSEPVVFAYGPAKPPVLPRSLFPPIFHAGLLPKIRTRRQHHHHHHLWMLPAV